MHKSNFPYLMKQVYNTGLYWKCVIRKINKNFFLKILDSNTTNIVKDIFIFQQKTYKKLTSYYEKVLTLKKFGFWKKNQNINTR